MASPSSSRGSTEPEAKDPKSPTAQEFPEVVEGEEKGETAGKGTEEKEEEQQEEKDTGNWQAVFSAEANAWYFWSKFTSSLSFEVLLSPLNSSNSPLIL